ncbi:hypothetical protein ACFL6C_08770 [Myxococcota bacterium]
MGWIVQSTLGEATHVSTGISVPWLGLLGWVGLLVACGSPLKLPDVHCESAVCPAPTSSPSQVVEQPWAAPDLSELPPCEGDPLDALSRDALMPPPKSSDGYEAATQGDIGATRNAIRLLISDRAGSSIEAARNAHYGICRGVQDDRDLVLFRPEEIRTGRAVFIIRTGDARPLIISAPHPFFEYHTRAQALEMFSTLGARSIVVSGTHRCANRGESPCFGYSGVCHPTRQREALRESDMAHTTQSVFQAAHMELAILFPETWIVSLHGMRRDGVALGDGTLLDTIADAPIVDLAIAVRELLPNERLTLCNDYPGNVHFPMGWPCGENNTQALFVNGVAGCSVQARRSSSRFLHVEQSIHVREQRGAIMEALDWVVPQTMGP